MNQRLEVLVKGCAFTTLAATLFAVTYVVTTVAGGWSQL